MSCIINPYRFASAGTIGNATALANNYRHPIVTLSNGNLTATRDASAASYANAASIDAKISGKWYFECVFDSIGADSEVAVGICDYTQSLAKWMGQDPNPEVSVISDGRVSLSPATDPSPPFPAMANGDRIGIAVDMDARTAKFRRNGGAWTASYAVAGTQPMLPMVTLFNPNDQATLNFGATPFVDAIPAGYSAWERNASYSGRYWRLTDLAYGGSGIFAGNIAEIALRTASGGSNVISGGTASADSSDSAPYVASKAIDGSASTFWASTVGSGAHWWQYDFGVSKAIVESAVTIRSDYLQYPSSLGHAYSTDGILFYPAEATAGLTWTLGETKTFTLG